ncbi:MAG: S-layer homology domain-containing protein [Acidimicrobiia bacterium]|nr:S-layer homology domain-containing protein [Acidimicrobiia bacterium]
MRVLSSPRFSLTVAGHVFADEIAWMAATGITEGFDDGTFRPGADVLRQAMAAFTHRFWDHTES